MTPARVAAGVRTLSERRASVLTIVATAVIVASTSAILVKWSHAPSVVKVFYRLLFTTLLIAPVALWRYRGDFGALSRRDLTVAIVTGVALAAHYLLWFESLNWTTVAASVTLSQTQTIFVAIGGAWVLDERVSTRRVIGILIGFFGAAIISTGGVFVTDLLGGSNPLLGNTLALSAGILFAGYLLAGRSLRQRVAVVPYMGIVYGVATVVTLVLALGSETRIALTAYPVREWLLFLGLALGPSVFSQGLVNWALAYIESSTVSVAFLASPVCSTLLAIAFLAEYPGPITVVGGSMVLFGIYLTIKSRA